MPSKVPTDVLGDSERPYRDTFTEWVAWAQRSSLTVEGLKVGSYPGVYLLAVFDAAAPSGAADYLDGRIEYVGKSKHMTRRWRDFERAARNERRSHSGGSSHSLRHGGLHPGLHVAALPVWFHVSNRVTEEPITSHFTAWAEAFVVCRIAAHRRGTAIPMLLNKPNEFTLGRRS